MPAHPAGTVVMATSFQQQLSDSQRATNARQEQRERERERQTDRWSGSYCSERLRIEMLYYRQRHVWPLTQQHTEIKDRMKPLRIEFNFLNAMNLVLVLHLAVYFSYVNSCIKNSSSQFSIDIVAHSSKEACISGVWVFICIHQQRSLTPQSQQQTEF